MPLRLLLPLPLAATAGLLLAGTAYGQSAAPLSTMPMPPSASEPAPKETKKKPASDRPARKRATERSTEQGEPTTAQRRSNAASSGATADRPRRLVPEEYDRSGSEEGSRAKPFVTEGGRPGMGMRF
ncbi:hypothetical protein [uncultured Enterovirga sp.]|uniref:hypothetical protein n=1 Tax=uncultured Enterovirga sp. TaxID=2026352 RepID=UPI0035CC4EA8